MTLTDFEQEELDYHISYREADSPGAVMDASDKSRYSTARRYGRNQRGGRPTEGMQRRRHKRHGL